ncbi:putative NAD-dependent epimerase/dehydratase [Pullulanibacillus camelliae]|uniref:Putative NAD-dependent epimerase/dehydratase n=1 Tax=Pullulanibacillus camelliae TaxID=1707096 RepID=A0A8J2YBH9_9BACL|nr:SDR family oxidoreductase [Pullulanibacillus camelliae]GGE28106.1 putative NAD-dependent epimerase/dehydratase [Pullulanibacillus camelliae]
MRVFVTGATGYIGSAVVNELINGGHTVIGLARSDRGAAELKNAGAEVHHGSLDDLDSLRSGAAHAEGVIHLAFIHDFSNFAHSLATDLSAIKAFGEVLEGTGKPFITTAHANGTASDNEVLALAKRGVQASVVSLAPSVHGNGDKGFVPELIKIAREKGVSAYIGDGSNRWPAIHRLDAARLYRLALEKAPAGSQLDGVGDEGVPFRNIASIIGQHLNVPLESISQEKADVHFGFLGTIASLDFPRSSETTQKLLGWQPVHPGLIDDLEQGHYFNS